MSEALLALDRLLNLLASCMEPTCYAVAPWGVRPCLVIRCECPIERLRLPCRIES